MRTTLRKNSHSRQRRRRRRSLLRALLVVLCLCALIWGVTGLVRFQLRTRKTAEVNQELEQTWQQAQLQTQAPSANTPPPIAAQEGFQFIGTQISSAAQKLLARNPDYTFWLEIPDVLSLPVVYRDNEYYLTHDFNGGENDSGTLFLDQYHPFVPDSQYLIVHGHAMHDGSMFGALVKFREDGYLETHDYLYFDTLYRQEVYRAVAVLEVSEDEMYTLMRLGAPGFLNEAEFALFAQRIEEEALHLSGEKLSPTDSLLALSTCWKDGRIVVLYRRV